MREWGGKGEEGRKVERERGRRDAARWGVERRRTGSICDDVRVIGGGGGWGRYRNDSEGEDADDRRQGCVLDSSPV
jgi:hypothetical protein